MKHQYNLHTQCAHQTKGEIERLFDEMESKLNELSRSHVSFLSNIYNTKSDVEHDDKFIIADIAKRSAEVETARSLLNEARRLVS